MTPLFDPVGPGQPQGGEYSDHEPCRTPPQEAGFFGQPRLLANLFGKRVLAFIPMFIVGAAFWSLYQQQFTVLTIYSDERLNRSLFGWEMPVSWVQSINPVFVIVLSGVFAAMWTRLGARQPSTPVKLALGTIVMGVAFLLFLPMPSGAHAAPVLGLTGILLVFTVAELLLSPVGLTLATKLAPQAYRSQMVALFLLSVGPRHGDVGRRRTSCGSASPRSSSGSASRSSSSRSAG